MNDTPSSRSLVIGTAGHIDHGKSTLIKALTGTDPDRLAEEKKRGITIELGFAQLTLPDGTAIGVVDVPGHERFVKQMIAGASGIDVALLCIAADDGVMPQTQEHLAILELLNIQKCIVVLTKCDLVDEEWIELVSDEIRETLKPTSFNNASIIAVSAHTGEGLDTLLATISEQIQTIQSSRNTGAVRLPIDRAFTIKGAGTVITGTLWQGSIHIDDELEILPTGLKTRVRSIQTHNTAVDSIDAGNRTALNLAGIKTSQVRPGDFLVTPHSLQTSYKFDARFTFIPLFTSGKPLNSGTVVRVSHGTREVLGRLLFMDGKKAVSEKETLYAQLRLDSPLPLSRGDRFVVRSVSPVMVIGGGIVLNSIPHHRTNLTETDRHLLDALAQEDELKACEAVIDASDLPLSLADISRVTGKPEQEISELLSSTIQEKHPAYQKIEQGGTEYWIRQTSIKKHLMILDNILLSLHAQHREATGFSKSTLRQHYPFHLDEAQFEVLFDQAVANKKIVFIKGEASHPKASAGARNLEEQAKQTLLETLISYGTTPPPLEEVYHTAGLSSTQGKKAVLALEEAGQAQRINKTLCFSSQALESLERAVRNYLESKGQATVTELKDAMKTSRKYAVPLLEYFDEQKITVRTQDLRSLA